MAVRNLSVAWSGAPQVRGTASVHLLLLAHMAAVGFTGAPRPLGLDDRGRDRLTFSKARRSDSARSWPAWTHFDEALAGAAGWLRQYRHAVNDFVPPAVVAWHQGRARNPGLIVAHNDAAPYNAVWGTSGLLGFVDWDMDGPMTREADVAWMVCSWVPVHARAVVTAEGFTAFSARRTSLQTFLCTFR